MTGSRTFDQLLYVATQQDETPLTALDAIEAQGTQAVLRHLAAAYDDIVQSELDEFPNKILVPGAKLTDFELATVTAIAHLLQGGGSFGKILSMGGGADMEIRKQYNRLPGEKADKPNEDIAKDRLALEEKVYGLGRARGDGK